MFDNCLINIGNTMALPQNLVEDEGKGDQSERKSSIGSDRFLSYLFNNIGTTIRAKEIQKFVKKASGEEVTIESLYRYCRALARVPNIEGYVQFVYGPTGSRLTRLYIRHAFADLQAFRRELTKGLDIQYKMLVDEQRNKKPKKPKVQKSHEKLTPVSCEQAHKVIQATPSKLLPVVESAFKTGELIKLVVLRGTADKNVYHTYITTEAKGVE